MNKPLTIDEILGRYTEKLIDITRSVVQNPQSPKAWLDVKDYAHNNNLKEDVSQLIAEIVGPDHEKRWNGDFCDTCNAFLEDDRFQCYCDIVNKQKGIERQRAKERGIDL